MAVIHKDSIIMSDIVDSTLKLASVDFVQILAMSLSDCINLESCLIFFRFQFFHL